MLFILSLKIISNHTVVWYIMFPVNVGKAKYNYKTTKHGGNRLFGMVKLTHMNCIMK